MKKIMAILSILIFTTTTYAGSTICSSTDLYFADIHNDYGAYPPQGSEVGSLEIKFKNKVLHKEIRISGLGQHVIASHAVSFVGNRVSISSTGSEISGSATYATTAVLYEVNYGNTKVELAREVVVCERTWAMYP